ncbi:MAG: hypothetical protein WHT65_05635 [Pseudothermotoga sp.]
MKKMIVFILLLVTVLILADSYAVYHLSVPGYSTSLLISNMSEEKAYFRISAFDCYGKKLWQNSYNMSEYSTMSVDLAKFITSGDDNWGLLLIECDQLLSIAVMYQDETYGLLNGDHVIEPIQYSEDAKYYWYAAVYAVKGSSSTTLALMNPNKKETEITIWICESNGETVEELTATLEPFSSAFLDLAKYIQEDIGVVDIQSDLPIAIGVEHYEDDELWTVDNIVDWYTTTEW